MAPIIPFRPRKGPWLPSERCALAAIQQALDTHGLLTAFVEGEAKDGMPWQTFYDGMTGSFTASVSRDKNGYVLGWADGTVVRADVLNQLVTAARSWTGRTHGTASSQR